ncbi:hypothetical protein V2J09_012859 [Rumex salicifolius]
MNWLLWNCQGVNKPNFRRSIRYIMKRYEIDLLALFETHVDAVVHSGVYGYYGSRLWVKSSLLVQTLSMFMLEWEMEMSATRRSGLWGELKVVIQNLSSPVFIGRDFNTIVRLDERTWGVVISLGNVSDLRQIQWLNGMIEFYVACRLD